MPRTEYETQISSLSSQVAELGGMAVEAVEWLRASLASDSLAVEAVHPDLVEDDDGTAWGRDAIAPVGHAIAASRARERVERLCVDLLLLQQPRARDLRLVVAALRAAPDLSRICAMADAAAELLDEGRGAGGDDGLAVLISMADGAASMVASASRALVRHDEALAAEVARADERQDGLMAEMGRLVVEGLRCARLAPEGVPEVLMVAKYLERIADRAVRVASWGAFRETGYHLDAQALAERDPSRGDWRVP